MTATKIQLSPDELQLMGNSEWILTKNRIIEKVCLQFGALSVQMQEEMKRRNPLRGETGPGPKISRGEKYEGLPYVMLDYPRKFEREHILAIRSLFWWGNFVSITLHVKGRFKAAALSHIVANAAVLQENQAYISVKGDEWNHNINSSDYTLLSPAGAQQLQHEAAAASFIKVAVKIDFDRWNEMAELLLRSFCMMVQLAA